MPDDDSYFEVRNEFYGDTDGFILVFDMDIKETFSSLNRWIDEAKRYGADFPNAILCGNKVDNPKLVVTNEEAVAFAKKLNIPFFDTSAKSGKNVNECF
jgi:GTPase SAR1 family protein